MLINVIIEPPFILVLGVIKTDLRIGVDFFQPKLHGKLLIKLVIPVILGEAGRERVRRSSGRQWEVMIGREGGREMEREREKL